MPSTSPSVGNVMRLQAMFTTTSGAFLDPTLVTFTVRPPASTAYEITSTSTSIVHPSSGVYYLDQTLTLPGTWTWRAHSTGTGTAAEESWFAVNHSQVTT